MPAFVFMRDASGSYDVNEVLKSSMKSERVMFRTLNKSRNSPSLVSGINRNDINA